MNSPDIFHFTKHFLKNPELRTCDLADLYKRLEINSKNPLAAEDCTFFTLETSEENPFLTECLKKLNIEYINVGEASHFNKVKELYPMEKCKYPMLGKLPSWKFTYIWKMMALYHYMKENRFKKYFFYLDQRDVLMVDTPHRSLEIFKSSGCDLIFNADQFCVYFPMSVRQDKEVHSDVNKYFANYGDVKKFEEDTYSDEAFVDEGHKTRYLNGGCFMGHTDYYFSFLENYHDFIMEFLNLDDQAIMHHFHFCYYPKIKLDNKGQIFRRICSKQELGIKP